MNQMKVNHSKCQPLPREKKRTKRKQNITGKSWPIALIPTDGRSIPLLIVGHDPLYIAWVCPFWSIIVSSMDPRIWLDSSTDHGHDSTIQRDLTALL